MKLLWNHCLIHYWKGTDALKLDTFPPTIKPFRWYTRILLERMLCKFLEPFTAEHWLDHEILQVHLLNFGIDSRKMRIVPDKVFYSEPVKKIPHYGLNVLFYCPYGNDPVFTAWLYGRDIAERVKAYFKDDPFVVVTILTDNKSDMIRLYGLTDCYVRPSRHDGAARMVTECKINNIPTYFSRDGKPDFTDIIIFITKQRFIKSNL